MIKQKLYADYNFPIYIIAYIGINITSLRLLGIYNFKLGSKESSTLNSVS